MKTGGKRGVKREDRHVDAPVRRVFLLYFSPYTLDEDLHFTGSLNLRERERERKRPALEISKFPGSVFETVEFPSSVSKDEGGRETAEGKRQLRARFAEHRPDTLLFKPAPWMFKPPFGYLETYVYSSRGETISFAKCVSQWTTLARRDSYSGWNFSHPKAGKTALDNIHLYRFLSPLTLSLSISISFSRSNQIFARIKKKRKGKETLIQRSARITRSCKT